MAMASSAMARVVAALACSRCRLATGGVADGLDLLQAELSAASSKDEKKSG